MLIAHNRDEYYVRPSQPLSYIEDKKAYAGIDLRYGGTWFCVDTLGRFAFVTNIRNKALAKADRPTRGELPFLALEGEADFLDNAQKYNPFNLVWGDTKRINYFNNLESRQIVLQEELLSMSNCLYPCAWPKSQKGKESFKKIVLDWDDERIFEESFKAMQDRDEFDFVPAGTGFEPETEKKLTPMFVQLPNYGTVSTTVMLVGEDGIRIEERRWPSGEQSHFILRPH